MGFIYSNKITYLNTFVIQLAQRCSDNGGSTVQSLERLHIHGNVLDVGVLYQVELN